MFTYVYYVYCTYHFNYYNLITAAVIHSLMHLFKCNTFHIVLLLVLVSVVHKLLSNIDTDISCPLYYRSFFIFILERR
ncbi:unnamed protein product, partial [Schistosoma guineensis]